LGGKKTFCLGGASLLRAQPSPWKGGGDDTRAFKGVGGKKKKKGTPFVKEGLFASTQLQPQLSGGGKKPHQMLGERNEKMVKLCQG